MTQRESQAASPAGRKSSKDRWIKVLMAVVVLGALAAVYLTQVRPPGLEGDWSTDLETTLALAGREDRMVLALFSSDPPNDATSWVIRKSLNHDIVRRALERGKQLCVSVKVDRGLKSDLPEKYKLRELPTVIVFAPDGSIMDRKSGRVGPDTIQRMLTEAELKRKSSP